MPTRRAQEGPTPQEKFMSSPFYTARRGVLGNAVAAKAQLYSSAKWRSLLFFLQGLSLRNGGLTSVTEMLFQLFPDRLAEGYADDESQDRYLAYITNGVGGNSRVPRFAEFLESVCIDPRLDLELLRSQEASGAPRCFRDPIGALLLLREHLVKSEAENTVLTSLGREVHKHLDRALATGRMTIMEGKSGSGKSFAAESWCRAHLGEARFVSLSGITHRTGFFQKLGMALGLAVCQQASSKLQAAVEAHCARTRLMLVIDEAHYLFPQHRRSHSAPELVDWVNTALVNNGVPVALIATDQFAKLKTRTEKQVGWTSAQLIHRTWRYQILPEQTPKEDLQAVAKILLSYLWNSEERIWTLDRSVHPDALAVKVISGTAHATALPLPAVRSIVDEARLLAVEAGRKIVGLADIRGAIAGQEQSDLASQLAYEAPERRGKKPSSGAQSLEQMSNFSRATRPRPATPSKAPARASLTAVV